MKKQIIFSLVGLCSTTLFASKRPGLSQAQLGQMSAQLQTNLGNHKAAYAITANTQGQTQAQVTYNLNAGKRRK